MCLVEQVDQDWCRMSDPMAGRATHPARRCVLLKALARNIVHSLLSST